MKRRNTLIMGLIILICIISCKLFEKEDPKPIEVYGCMDSTATNYNPDATIDNGSCDYCKEGSSLILLSTDGGNNWDMRCLKDEIGEIHDISLIDSNNIWVGTAYPTDGRIQLLHTSDGGYTWEEQYALTVEAESYGNFSFDLIRMFDLYNGIAVASNYNPLILYVLRTTDGGNSWSQTTNSSIGITGDLWRRLDFVDINTGFIRTSGVSPQRLYKTTNSGQTWNELDFNPTIQVMKFFNENIGLAVDHDSTIHRTINGGVTWEEIKTNHTGWGLDIEFNPNDPSRVWMLTGGLFFSSDTGSTWDYCFDNTHNGSDAISFSNSSLWVYNMRRYLRNVDINNCSSYIEYQLPEYSHGWLDLGYDFDVIGDVIVIPGQFFD